MLKLNKTYVKVDFSHILFKSENQIGYLAALKFPSLSTTYEIDRRQNVIFQVDDLVLILWSVLKFSDTFLRLLLQIKGTEVSSNQNMFTDNVTGFPLAWGRGPALTMILSDGKFPRKQKAPEKDSSVHPLSL